MYFPSFNPFIYNKIIKELRKFFDSNNFIEVYVTPGRILAACEDPFTIKDITLGKDFHTALPQTGQMGLEEIILTYTESFKLSNVKGIYYIGDSIRNEPNIIEGRHYYIFRMFEFEFFGNFEELLQIHTNLLKYFGFSNIKIVEYEDACKYYNTDIIESKHELDMCKNNTAVLLINFPLRAQPFWNMRLNSTGDYALKCDVLLPKTSNPNLAVGETIGSAERAISIPEMLTGFDTIMNGTYKEKLYELFTKEKVDKELDNYLNLFFNRNENDIIRSGAGIGLTRLYNALT